MAELIALTSLLSVTGEADFVEAPDQVYRVQGKANHGDPDWDVWGQPRPVTSGAMRLVEEFEALSEGGDLGHRFSHPLGHFRETYAATCVVGALLELWSFDTPDAATVDAAGDVRRGGPPLPQDPHLLPRVRFERREVIFLHAGGKHCDVAALTTRTWLSRHKEMEAPRHRVGDRSERLDSELLEGSGASARVITQHASMTIYDSYPEAAGLRYRTRLGGDHVNWTVFERSGPSVLVRTDLDERDPAVLQALELLGLKLESA